MNNVDIDFMKNADGVAFDTMREGLVVTSPFSDDAAEVENWEEKAEETGAPETSKGVTGGDLADYFMAEFLKGDGEGDGDDEPSLGRGVTLDLDMAKHMDRYHPEGITEKSTCKYIGNREGENDTPVDYYEKKGNISTKDAFEWFSERYNISCYQPKTADDIKDLCLSSKRTDKLLKGRPLSKSEFDNTVLFLYRVCEDIKSRFPEVKFGIDFIYFWDDAPTNSGGTCTLDRREGIGYMFIGGSEALHKRQSLNYYHEDDRMLYDVIRHELGHSLSSSRIKREFNTLFSNERIEEYGRTKLAYDLATKVSLAAAEFLYIEGDRDKDIAKEECIAELFSVYTSPWYTKGTLPFGAEKFVEAMIKGEGLPMQIDMLQKTEDGFTNKGGKERRPEWIRGMEVIDPMPMRDYSKPFYTWDDYNEEWKYFNTTDERDRYNAWLEEKASRVSAEDKKIWIEEMCRCMKKKCNAQWQSMSNTAMDSVDKPNIFDPEEFDQNSFEWGAIYWINQIRDAVEEFEDGYVVPDEQFIEMLRPLKKAAKVYAEAHGKDKAWVKNTVLSVPKAFANAFDTLSDGEGVSKEHFLKVLTVDGVCALAAGEIDSVHELEDYYYRKGQYSPKGGYEVGKFVVIIKDPPSKDRESERIRHIIAIRGEKGDDDPTLVFWNASKSGIVERKASQCSKPFHKCDEAYAWWFVENGDGARPLKKTPAPEKDGGLSAAKDILKLGGDMNAIAADAIEDIFGIGQDALDPNDADFWAKHDKARHGGHFDPETMTCKLREKYEQGEKIENLKDEMDDIEVEEAPDVGASGYASSGHVTPEEDAAYLEAVKRGNMKTAEQMVRDAAMASGFTTHVYHGTELEYFNNGKPFTIFDAASHFGTKEIAEHVAKSKSSETKGNAPYVYSVFLKLDNPKRVSDTPKSWNDTHSEYWWNQMHMAAEEGYDGLVYSNKYEDKDKHDDSYVPLNPSQIKSADSVTYDDEGNVIPLSRRFDDGPDIRGDVNWQKRGDLNSDPDYDIISEVLKAEKDRQNGKPAQLHQRVPEEALRGSDEGTRILREASLVCRATEGTGSQGEGNSGGGDGRGEGAPEGAVSGVEQAREASRRQEAILEKYAKKLGIWEDDVATALKERDDYDYIEGGETIAFFPDDTSKPLTKVITSAYFPETVQLLDRIILHNYLFPYSKLNVKGFGRARPDWLTDGDSMFCVKVEQQPVDTSCPAKPEQIEEYMKNLGFHKHRELAGGDMVWESNDGKYVVSDLTDENVFLTQDGHIAVIDANIQLNTPGSDGSGKYKIPSFRGSGQAEDSLNEVLAEVVEAAYGIGEDALDPNDPDFWMKHDRAKHGGHFDPETQTCKLREKAQAAEEQREQEDERDDIQTSDAPEAGNKIANAMLIGTKVIQENRKYDPTKDNSELDLKELHNENTGDVVGLYDRATNTVRLFDGADVHTLVHELGGHATMQFAEQCAAAGNDTLLKKINESIDTAPPEVWNKVRKSYHQLNNESDKDYEERLRDEVWAAVVEGKSKTIEEVKKTEKGQKWWKKAWNTVKACWAGILGRMGIQIDWASDNVKNMSPDVFQEFIVKAVKEGRTLGNMKKGGSASGMRQAMAGQEEKKEEELLVPDPVEFWSRPHIQKYLSQGGASAKLAYTLAERCKKIKDITNQLTAIKEELDRSPIGWHEEVGNILTDKFGDPLWGARGKDTSGVWKNGNYAYKIVRLHDDHKNGSINSIMKQIILNAKFGDRYAGEIIGGGSHTDDEGEKANYIIIKQPWRQRGKNAESKHIKKFKNQFGLKDAYNDQGEIVKNKDSTSPFLTDGEFRYSDFKANENYVIDEDGDLQIIDLDVDRLDTAKQESKEYDNGEDIFEAYNIDLHGILKPANKRQSSVVKMAMGQDSADDRMVEFRDLLAKKFPDKDATAIISELGKIKSAKGKRIISGEP